MIALAARAEYNYNNTRCTYRYVASRRVMSRRCCVAFYLLESYRLRVKRTTAKSVT